MAKEICISSTPHETRLAILEDDQLAEIYYERENEYTLAGSIYNGRVTRVLPGMQSAFVDIGLERDAFLYVTDFLELEDQEETDELEKATASSPNQPPREVRHERRAQWPAAGPSRARAAPRPEGDRGTSEAHSSHPSPRRRRTEAMHPQKKPATPAQSAGADAVAVVAVAAAPAHPQARQKQRSRHKPKPIARDETNRRDRTRLHARLRKQRPGPIARRHPSFFPVNHCQSTAPFQPSPRKNPR